MSFLNNFKQFNTSFSLQNQNNWFATNFNTPTFDFSNWNIGNNTDWKFPQFFNFSSTQNFTQNQFDFTKMFAWNSNLWNNSTPQQNYYNNNLNYNIFGDYKFTFNSGTFGDTFKKTDTSDFSYSTLSQREAYQKALKDPNLEHLTKGRGWEVDESQFKTDIPFAKKGTGAILTKVSEMTGLHLVINSALGTGEANGPHQKGGYVSHHNKDNPKIDLKIVGDKDEFVSKLKATGYFSHIYPEATHVDVQIDIKKYEELV